MTRFLPLALLAFLPLHTAEAGVGTTIGMGSLDINIGQGIPTFRNNAFLPTLDYRNDPLVLQFHVLEIIDNLADEQVYLGANFYYEVHNTDVGSGWVGVVQPGASVDIFGDPFVLGLVAEARFGIELSGDAGFGIHVVPGIGLLVGDIDTELITSGALQVGMWF